MTELNKEPPAVPSEKVGQINFGLEYDYQQNTLILRIIAVSKCRLGIRDAESFAVLLYTARARA